jgi:hypothetical protein
MLRFKEGDIVREEDFINAAERSVDPADDEDKLVKLEETGRLHAIFTNFGFGDGHDGDVVISSPTTLTEDKYYNNLTVNSTLTTNGYKIYVKEKIDGSGTIRHSDPSTGHGQNAPSSRAGGGSGSSSGIVFIMARIFAGSFSIQSVGSNGGNGGVGDTGSSGPGGDGGAERGAGPLKGCAGKQGASSTNASNNGNVGNSGESVNPSLGSNGANGGTGGTAGDFNIPIGGPSGGVSTAPLLGIAQFIKFFATTLLCYKNDLTLAQILKVPGAGSGSSGAIDASPAGRGGGGGGASGNGGHAIIIFALKLWTGTYNLSGGTPGTGGTGSGTGGGNGGNGGTGNEGVSYELDIADLI